MNQIGIKLPESEIRFLEWYALKYASSKAGIYRDATIKAFQNWKVNILLDEYQQGKIGFKEMCNLGNLSLLEGMNLIESEGIEPPITDLMDEYSMILVHENIKQPSSLITKTGKPLKRKSPPIIFD